MGLVKRRTPTVPADLRDRLEIPAREKLLAWGDGPRGDSDRPSALVAATDSALYVEAAGEPFTNARVDLADQKQSGHVDTIISWVSCISCSTTLFYD